VFYSLSNEKVLLRQISETTHEHVGVFNTHTHFYINLSPYLQMSSSVKRTFATIGEDANSVPFAPQENDSSEEELRVSKRRKLDVEESPCIKRGRWDKYEHSLFVKGLQIYGRQWKLIAEMVRPSLCSKLTENDKTHTHTHRSRHVRQYKFVLMHRSISINLRNFSINDWLVYARITRRFVYILKLQIRITVMLILLRCR
jgi:hypothetical protein